MTKKIVFSVPIFLIIISIITSVVAFVYSQRLENGFIYVTDSSSVITYEGEYFALLGNLGESSSFVSVNSLNQELLITIYDSNASIIKEYTLQVKKEGSSYSKDIINSFIGSEMISIDDLDEYIFTLDLEKDETYETIFTKTSNNIDVDEIDIILINIPEQLLNMKNLNEGIAFTTLIFAIISGLTILVVLYVKKDD